MDKIKLIDKTFAHEKLGYGSSLQTSKLFSWDRNIYGITKDKVVYTDMTLHLARNENAFAWLMEPIELAPQNYHFIMMNSHKFRKVYTHEKLLLDLGGNFEFVSSGGCWILTEDQKIYEKTKNLSIIASNKSTISGHKFRHDVIHHLRNDMDTYGRGWNPLEYKLDGLKDYRYSIVIENCKRDYWFTEKLIDVLVCGCIPIYWGCPSIDNFFDPRGFIIFDNLDDLDKILPTLTEEKYLSMMPYIEANFERAKNYILPDEQVYKKVRDYNGTN